MRLPGSRTIEVDHLDRPARCRGGERLFLDREAEGGDLPGDVGARLPNGRRAGRPRADRDHLTQVLPGACAVEGQRRCLFGRGVGGG